MCTCERMHVIAEGKMSLSRVVVSQQKSIIDTITYEGKSIARSSMRERRNRARGLVIML